MFEVLAFIGALTVTAALILAAAWSTGFVRIDFSAETNDDAR